MLCMFKLNTDNQKDCPYSIVTLVLNIKMIHLDAFKLISDINDPRVSMSLI